MCIVRAASLLPLTVALVSCTLPGPPALPADPRAPLEAPALEDTPVAAPDESTGPDEPPARLTCEDVVTAPEVDARVLLVVDRSGSMSEALGDSGIDKFSELRQSIVALTSQPSVESGLLLFPERGGDVCDQGSQLVPLMPESASMIEEQLASTAPSGGTPTASTLAAAREIVEPLATSGPVAVLLATDGGPNCNPTLAGSTCECTDPTVAPGDCSPLECIDEAAAVSSVDAIHALGVKTFVVGLGPLDTTGVLDAMAKHGGTARAGDVSHYAATESHQLLEHLAAIEYAMRACRVTSATQLAGADAIEVRVGEVAIARDVDRENGFDLVAPNVVELFGPACDLVVTSGDDVTVSRCTEP